MNRHHRREIRAGNSGCAAGSRRRAKNDRRTQPRPQRSSIWRTSAPRRSRLRALPEDARQGGSPRRRNHDRLDRSSSGATSMTSTSARRRRWPGPRRSPCSIQGRPRGTARAVAAALHRAGDRRAHFPDRDDQPLEPAPGVETLTCRIATPFALKTCAPKICTPSRPPRPVLLGLAYRILGLASRRRGRRAGHLHQVGADREGRHRKSAAWLTTACTRRCIDLLRAAHRTRGRVCRRLAA